MIHAIATCPVCKIEIEEKEDGWFLCYKCNGHWDWEELEKLSIIPKFYIRKNDERIIFVENLIDVDPEIMLGKPVIASTRITVELVMEKFADGATVEQIIEEYPQLTQDSVFAAYIYAMS